MMRKANKQQAISHEADKLLDRLGLPARMDGMAVLDLSCGDGFFCSVAVRRGAARVVGLNTDGVQLRRASSLYGSLGIEFREQAWRRLPSERFDLVLWLSTMEQEQDPLAALESVRGILEPDGLLILECGQVQAPGKELIAFGRSSGTIWYPTRDLLLQILRARFAVREVAEPEFAAGDPIPRSVFHCVAPQPIVMLIKGGSGEGKTSVAEELLRSADKVVHLDSLVSRVAAARQHGDDLQRLIRDNFASGNLGLTYAAIDDQGLTDAYAALVASTVAPSDRLVVIEGFMTDAQAAALAEVLAGRARVWNVTRAT
jgi:SAM-dependent methyltransferase